MALAAGALAAISLLGLVTGCRLIKGTADLPGKAVRVVAPDKSGPDTTPLELQSQLMRFADEQVARFITAFKEANELAAPKQHVTLMELKVLLASDLWSIASGANAYANLLDMLVVLSLARQYAETQWSDQLGEAAQPLTRAAIAGEEELWRIAGRVLNSEQQDELRSVIHRWQETHPFARDILFARALNLSHQFAQQQKKQSSQQSASVFQFLSLDPLAGLDPATRELMQTRMFAERALYIGQRMPFLLRWQFELMSEKTRRTPEFQQALTNAQQIAYSIEQIGHLAGRLPDRLTQERKAILQAVNAETGQLQELTARIQAALAQGNALATNADLALHSFERVLQHFPAPSATPTSPPPASIEDYTEAARAFTTTAQELAALLDQVDQTLGSTNLARLTRQVTETMDAADSRGRAWVDYAFRRLVLAILVAALALLCVLVAYRWLSHRLAVRPAQPPPSSDDTSENPPWSP